VLTADRRTSLPCISSAGPCSKTNIVTEACLSLDLLELKISNVATLTHTYHQRQSPEVLSMVEEHLSRGGKGLPKLVAMNQLRRLSAIHCQTTVRQRLFVMTGNLVLGPVVTQKMHVVHGRNVGLSNVKARHNWYIEYAYVV
jgi:hypothetical protein